MKRYLRKLAALMLALAVVLSGCSKNGENDSTGAADQSTGAADQSTGAADQSTAGAEAGDSVLSETVPPVIEIEEIGEYVKLGQYMGVEAVKNSAEVTEDEIQQEIDYLLDSYVENEQITEGVVAEGDTVNIDFEGKLDGVAFEGGTGNSDLTIGSNSFIDGFEDGLIGVNVGDTVDLNLTFPDPYKNNPDLAGKAVVFTVTVHYIVGDEIRPEFNDEFAVKLGFADEKEMRESFIQMLESEKQSAAENEFGAVVWETAAANAEILKHHDEIYNTYYDNFFTQYTSMANAYGMDLDTYLTMTGATMDQFTQIAEEYAQSCMEQELVCRAIVEAEQLTVTDEEYQELLNGYYQQYSSTGMFAGPEDLEAYYSKDRLIQDVLWSKAINLVVDNAVALSPEEAPESTETAESTAAAG